MKLLKAIHGDDRVFLFGAPFAMRDRFSDKERDFSKLAMKTWGKFIKTQK